MPAWYESRFTGLFTLFVRVNLRAHDPSIEMTAGEMPPWEHDDPELGCGGAGWTAEQAELASLGEAIERILARALPCDESIQAAYTSWSLDEPAVDPQQWVLFHPEQYTSDGFPFVPLKQDTVCRWVCCREASTGMAKWVPEEMVFLTPRTGECQQHLHGFSTGLTCGRVGDPVLLRGVQEVIERDALIGGWWGRYPVEEWSEEEIRNLLGSATWKRVNRPNLRFHFYRIRSPFSSHVTMISVSGQDEEGWVFSIGSACRESRRESWRKALLEAVQGRHCVRRLLAQWHENGQETHEVPKTFLEHALFYALHRERLSETVLENAENPTRETGVDETEGLTELNEKLGPDRPVLFRNLSPPGLALQFPEWHVLRVLIPGLQPLHGDHRLPFLGGPLWQPRRPADWRSVPPHPFA